MKIIISPRAEKQLRKISKVHQIIIAKKIRTFTSVQTKQLIGYKHIYRTRIGDYRIVYKKINNEIHIIHIAHRKEIYHLLDRLLN